MYQEPKISVIMPSYNVGPYIQQCIESVVNQTLKDIEIICIDSGSTDETLAVLEQYAEKDPRIKILHSEKKSYGHQVNLGLAAAKGEYIGIVETDDFIRPEMYTDLYNLTDNGKIDIVKGNFWKYYSDNGENKYIVNKVLDDLPKDGTIMTLEKYPRLLRGHPSIWSAIYKKTFLDNIKIKFIEEPGGGWVDNPFFFETFCAAESIR